MTAHIVCLAGPADDYKPKLTNTDQLIIVPIDIPDHPDALQTSVADVTAKFDLSPSQSVLDLLNAAVAAYTGDVRVSREEAFDGWTRDFVLHLAVANVELWKAATGTLEQALSFLTGDRWRVRVRDFPESYEPLKSKQPRRVQHIEAETVCLFSGGLDSFIGAIDEIENKGTVALVGHHSAGGGPTSKSQSTALDALRQVYSEERSPFLQFWVSPPKGDERDSEISTRGRSMMFVGLGVLVASGIKAGRLVVPENGFISLNVPLIPSRLGSLSTRTTHPFFISLIRTLLSQLDIQLTIDLPYRFRTKGEIIQYCRNQRLAGSGLDATMSCSHPSANRFAKMSPNTHCGYCLPCLVRRAAILASGVPDPTKYANEDLSQPLPGKKNSDLRALKLALDRFQRKLPRLADVLTAGPLPATDEEQRQYLAVFGHGLDELHRLLGGYK